MISKGRHDDAMKYIENAYKADRTKTRSRLINDPAFDPMKLNADSKIANKMKELLEGK